MEEQEQIKLNAIPINIRAESPDGPYMVERGQAAKRIFDTFILRIKEHYDLQR